MVFGVEARARTIDTFVGRGGSGGEEVSRAGSVGCARRNGDNIVDIDAGGDAEDGGRGVVDGDVVALIGGGSREGIVGDGWIRGAWVCDLRADQGGEREYCGKEVVHFARCFQGQGLVG